LIEILEVAKPDVVQRLTDVRQEPISVAAVAGPRVRAGLAVQP
jgi:hypothetical protein